MVELDHSYENGKPIEHNWETILDLEKLVSCVEGGSVTEATSPDSVKAQIKVALIDQDADAHRAVLQVKSREAGGQGHANADVTFTLADGGGTIHTAAQISGKAASMGEGVVQNVLDALITDFTSKLSAL
jgi:carbon monoxide dehydrogenase subunit G